MKMKKIICISALLLNLVSFAQEHFAGLATSSRVGILAADLNPAELRNMSHKFEINGFGTSINVANNKINFKDLTSGNDLEKQLFAGSEPVNLRLNAVVLGPGVAIKISNWAFAITSKANIKFDLIDVDTKLGDALTNGTLNSLVGASTLVSNNNQRLNGVTYGEVGLSIARTVFTTATQKINAGATVKLLFPGSYANLGLDRFNGKVTNTGGQVYLNNTNANLNIAYSGNLANGFSNFSDYSKSVFGALNGYAVDFGINYQLKGEDDSKNNYKLNFGMAVRNVGTMTFKDDNNTNTNYALAIQSTTANPLGLNLNQFNNVDNLQEIETILKNKGYLTIQDSKSDIKIKLPALFSAYADVKIIPKLYVSGYIQQKLSNDSANDQLSNPNIFTITPRCNLGFFEAFIPFTNNSVSGFNTGFGFRLGGFYMGSGSVITAIANNSKQADAYIGFRTAFL